MDNPTKTEMFRKNAMKSMSLAPEHPWNHTSPADLGPCITNFIDQHESYFRRWAESWFMTMMFVFGNHNYKWSRKMGFAVDFDAMRSGRRPQTSSYTNIARIAIEALVAGLYANIPSWDVDAMDSGAVTGRRQKKIMTGMLESFFNTLMMDKDVGAAAFVFAMFGQFSWESLWNPMAGRVIEVPRFIKQKQPAFSSYMAPNQATGGLIETPTMIQDTGGRPYLEDGWQRAKDQMGRDITDKIFTGNPGCSVLTPFEYRRAIGSVGMHKTRYTQIFRLLDYDKWLDVYGQMDGKTRFFGDVEPVYNNSTIYNFALRFFMRMSTVTPPSEDDYGGRWGALMGGASLKHKVLVVEHYDEPHPLKWPEGRRVVVANGACTHITKPQYNTGKMDGWHPLSEAQWMNTYPSSVASGPMQDLVKKNIEVNAMDTFISMAMRRTLGGQYLVKVGSGIDPARLTGEPGMAHEVTDPYGIRILHDDMAIPPVVQQIRQMNMDDAYNQSGALEAQRGGTDDGAKSGYQAKINEEREEKRLSPARKTFRNALAGAGEKLISATHKNVIHLDEAMMGYMLANCAGEFTPEDVVSFLSKPMGLGVQVKIVEGSMSLKSKATKQATMQELAQGPAAQRLGSDAKVLDKYLKEFDMDVLRDSSATHRDRAERENETFLDMMRLGFDMEGIVKPISIFEDDDQIHINEHTDFITKYWDLARANKSFLMEFYIHMETHRLQDEEKKAKLMPGTSLETGTMVQQASMTPRPSIQTIAIDSQNRKMQQAQNAGQGAATTDPKPAGSPPGRAPTSPTAPSQTTPAAQAPALGAGP